MGQKLVTIKFEQGSSSIFWNQKYNPVFKIEISRDGGTWVDVSNLEYCSRLLNIQPSAPILPGDLVTEQLTNSKLRKIIQKGQSLAFFVDDDIDFWRISYKDDFLTLGEWEELAGTTRWETIITQLLAEFRYRVAGGSDNSSLPERKGRAILQKVYGKTVKWNQLVPEFDNWSKRSVSNFTIVDNVVSFNTTAAYGGVLKEVAASSGHQYYVAADIKRTTSSGAGFLSLYQDNEQLKFTQTSNETFTHLSFITTSQSANNLTVLIMGGSVTCGLSAKGQKLVDLTDNFGTNAEIAAALGISVADITTATGVAAFEAWLALNGGTQDYYPYDEGSLISFKGQGVKSVGFNQWDEQWEVGFINSTTGGNDDTTTNTIRSKNYIRVFPGVDYYLYAKKYTCIAYYTIKKEFIDFSWNLRNTILQIPSNCSYIRISPYTGYGTTYNHDICINVSDPAKNGTYEPYWEDEADLSHAYINVWDEIVEDGGISTVDGSETATAGYRRSKSFIPVKGGTSYYIKTPVSIQLIFYNANKTFISAITALNEVRTTPQNCAYMRFRNANANAWPTYNHDICINVSNANINGTYYPHALQSAGSVTDEVTATGLTKKLRRITITAEILKYFRNSVGSHINIGYTDAHIADGAKVLRSATTVRNAITTLYGYTITGQDAAWITDMRIGIAANGQLAISNNSFTSLAEFQALCPFDIIYEVEDYITIPHDTPMQYAVDKYSTEEVIMPASVAGEPTSTAIVADIEYQELSIN